MNVPRAVTRTCLVVVALACLATPAAAQSVNRALIDELNTQLLYVALPLTLFVELTLLHAIYRFRDNDDPRPTTDDRALEITWTSATAVILVFVGVSGFVVLASPYLTPTGPAGHSTSQASASSASTVDADALRVDVLAYQWGWEFHYPAANVTTQTRLVVPVDRDVRLRLESTDVIHSLFVPELGLKQDIFPGQEQRALTRPTKTGEYRLYCAELCGAGHSRMHGTVVVLNRTEYDRWIANRSTASG